MQINDALSQSLNYRNPGEACDAVFVAGPVALAWSRLDDDSRARVRKRYLDAIDAWRSQEGYALPAEFVCLVAQVGAG